MLALNTAFMTDGAVVAHRRRRQARRSRCCSCSPRAGRGAAPRHHAQRRHASATAPRSRIVEAHVALPARGAEPGQRADARSSSATAPHVAHVKCTLAGEAREPSRQLARRRSAPSADYRAFQLTAGTGARAQPARASPSRARAPSSTSPAPSSAAAPSTSTRRWSSITRCPAATSRELFKGVLDGPRARRVPGQGDRAPRRAEDRRQADGAGADAVAGRRVRFQARARDLRRRRRLRSRLAPRPSSTRTCCSTALARHSAGARRARC